MTDQARIAETLRQCVAYVVRDCDEAGFHEAAYHLRRAVEELGHFTGHTMTDGQDLQPAKVAKS